MERWYAFIAFNSETQFGWGDEEQADRITDYLNIGRDPFNLYFPAILTDAEQLERLDSRQDDSGFDMSDYLICAEEDGLVVLP